MKKVTPEFESRALKVLERLKYHHETNGRKYKADKIAAQMKLSRNQVNSIMRYLRSDGHPVCSDADGYWYSTAKEDIQQTINHLQDRIYAMQCAIK